jgi:hypothetical protein
MYRPTPTHRCERPGCTNPATVRAGHPPWLLCDQCASLPRFQRYKQRPIKTASQGVRT